MNFKKSFTLFLLIFINQNINPLQNEKKLIIGVHTAGFFSAFFGVLNNLVWAERNNKIPVVYWDNNSVYHQNEGYNGSYNVWEYYFEPVSNLKYIPGEKIHYGYTDPIKTGFYYYQIIYNEKYCKSTRLFLNKIIKKYVKIKSIIKNKIDSFYEKNMLGKINIAVHLRGTDKGSAFKLPNYNIMLNEANKLANSLGNTCQFYVATDDVKLLKLAKKLLNRKVIYYDVVRSKNGNPIHLNSSNQISKAILGEQVLIDAQLLSKCDYFIHYAASNVAMAVLCFNPKIKTLLFDCTKRKIYSISPLKDF